MNLTIPDIIASSVAAACRLHAHELRSAVNEAQHHLAAATAFVADEDIERQRLAVLELEADNLLLVAKLISTQLLSVKAS